jgi:hypothetical protein
MATSNDFDRDAFLHALRKAFDMPEEDAEQVTGVVEDCFIGEDEVNDEDLEKETRALFYSLEAEGLLTFRRTEYKFEGAVRRAFFWRLTEAVTSRAALEDALTAPAHAEEDEALVYQSLHDGAWERSHSIEA